MSVYFDCVENGSVSYFEVMAAGEDEQQWYCVTALKSILFHH